MKVYCRGIAQIRDNSTGRIYKIECHELDWDAVGGDKRQMGMEIHYEAVIEHADLGELKWGLWEYPIGAENYNKTDISAHELVEDFDYGLEHEEPDPDEWLDFDVPSDPFAIYTSSYDQSSALLVERGRNNGHHLLNRMVFTHQITALEAYLGDTLMNAVVGEEDVTQRLINEDKELLSMKFTLAEIKKDPGLVEQKVRVYLRTILYHNLAKVDVLYKIALGIRILKLTTDKDHLFKAVKLRHDCVHRNGFDKDGKELEEFTKAFVQETADLIMAFVQSIEVALQQRASGSR